jgi:hypothetical protein
MKVEDWFEISTRDAERRGLPALVPLLEMLRRSTTALRATDWGDETDDIAGDVGRRIARDRADGRT